MSAAPLVFITGASSGIGQALAAQYARQGWRLALAARRVDAMQAWAQSLGLMPERCVAYAADVQQIDSIVDAGRRCIDEQGHVSPILSRTIVRNASMSPELLVAAPAADVSVAFRQAGYVFSGAATDGDGTITRVEYRVDGGLD